jgi:hypothetical protein
MYVFVNGEFLGLQISVFDEHVKQKRVHAVQSGTEEGLGRGWLDKPNEGCK